MTCGVQMDLNLVLMDAPSVNAQLETSATYVLHCRISVIDILVPVCIFDFIDKNVIYNPGSMMPGYYFHVFLLRESHVRMVSIVEKVW